MQRSREARKFLVKSLIRRIFKEHSALVERADAFRRLYHAGRFERALQAGREYSFRTGRFERADGVCAHPSFVRAGRR